MQRKIGKNIIVVGSTGSGKTTLANSIATILNMPHIELDALYWEANWTGTPDDIFIQKIENALTQAGEAWNMEAPHMPFSQLVWSGFAGNKTPTSIFLDGKLLQDNLWNTGSNALNATRKTFLV